MSERPSPIDALVDLVVYAPVGLALTLMEELPGLIHRGRTTVEPRLGTARLVGQFVVAEGRRRVPLFDGCGSPGAGGSTDSGGSAGAGGATGSGGSTSSGVAGHQPTEPVDLEEEGPFPPDPSMPTRSPRSTRSRARPTGRVDPSAPIDPSGPTNVLAAEDLAIPGYDSLSASQVVQRLAGLSETELVAVGIYETATRGRRTILSRVSQLQNR